MWSSHKRSGLVKLYKIFKPVWTALTGIFSGLLPSTWRYNIQPMLEICVFVHFPYSGPLFTFCSVLILFIGHTPSVSLQPGPQLSIVPLDYLVSLFIGLHFTTLCI
ncbi:hypothetical protein XENOCAPTIV_022466 [Xenoophorus captivus]|uniref:Uncharacterized protein n=1 Tax=Xenoophorus captivus TaxID=1517983 RepID=A0ABV0S007_9TELE